MRYGFLIALIVILVISPTEATTADEPVVNGILFFRPTCPHCHHFLENQYPAYQAEFGDQFNLVLIDTSADQGRTLFLAAAETLNIPQNRWAVPMMILGDTVMVGVDEMEAHARPIIYEALAGVGLAFPAIPGLEDYVGDASVDSSRFTDDLANVAAVGVLMALLASAGMVVVIAIQSFKQRRHDLIKWLARRSGQMVPLGIALVGLGMAISLLGHETNDRLAQVLAGLATAGLLIGAIVLGNAIYTSKSHRKIQLPDWIFPLVILSGLAVAVYLAYIEIGHEEATCGIAGDCNAVQESDYAELFGILPIGVLGIIGYGTMLTLWLLSQLQNQPLSTFGQLGLLGSALFGVIFSSYLTFLEPFVIKATCMWCLTSAVTMLLLLWLAIPWGWPVLEQYVKNSRQLAPRQKLGRTT